MKSNHRNITATAPVARIGIVCMLIATAFLACVLCAPQALAKQTVDMPDGWGVSDDITRIHVSKVDAGTHEALKGAKMAIIDRETGEVVDEWTTDGTTHETEKLLDVNREYILREVEAPEGYDKVEDTIFKVNEMEGTGISILSKDETTELSDSYKVTLYDQHFDFQDSKTKTVTQTRSSASQAPRTGDETPLLPLSMLAGAAILGIVVLLLAKRRITD